MSPEKEKEVTFAYMDADKVFIEVVDLETGELIKEKSHTLPREKYFNNRNSRQQSEDQPKP